VRRRLAAAAAALALLAGCSSEAAPEGELHGTVVDPPFEVGTTELSTTDGQAAAVQDTDARLTLLFFGYTNCTTECPAVLGTVTSALTRLSDARHPRGGPRLPRRLRPVVRRPHR
jgi:protein SCO1